MARSGSDDVIIKLQADVVDINKKISQVSSQFSSLEKNVRSTSARISASMNDVSRSVNLLKVAYAAIASNAVLRGTVGMADAMTNMRSRIMLVTSSTEEAAAVQQRLLDVANRTRTDFSAVGTLYARLGRSADELGISQERLIGFVETFSQALKVSGASTAEAESVTLQLSQALGSGQLRGEEFRSMMENGGRAAKALADGLGVPIGTLRQLAEEGKLTSDIVVKAMESQSGVIASEFSRMSVTASDSFVVLRNAIAETIGKVNEGTNATGSLSEKVIELASFIKQPDTIAGINAWAQAFADLGSVLLTVGEILNAANHGFNMLLSDGLYAAGAITKAQNEATRNRTLTSMAGEGATKVRDSLREPKEWKPSGKFGGAAIGGGWSEVSEPVATKPPPIVDVNKLLGGGSGAADKAKEAARRYAEVIEELQFQIAQLSRTEEEAALQEALRNNIARAGAELDKAKIADVTALTVKLQEGARAAREAAEIEQFAADIRQQFGDGSEETAAQIERLNRALAAGKISIAEYKAAMEEATKPQEIKDLEATWQSIGNSIENDLANAFVDMASGAKSANEAVAELLQSIGQLIAKQLILQAIQGITKSVFGDGGTGAVLADAFSGKALGGLVNPGNAYKVGESGPELFVPRVPGTIVPSNKMGGGGITINSTVNAAPGTNGPELQAMLDRRDAKIFKLIPQIMMDKQRRNGLGGAF